MHKYARLKIVHLLILLCFAVIVGCMVSIYSHQKTLKERLDHSEQELAANPAQARLASLEQSVAELRTELEDAEARNRSLVDLMTRQDETIKAQKEELKNVADQLRRLGAGK